MRYIVLAVFAATISSTAIAGPEIEGPRDTRKPTERLLQFAQSYSCSPRKTCSRTVRSCQEAQWLLANCSWGGRLDGDNDGVPCENLC